MAAPRDEMSNVASVDGRAPSGTFDSINETQPRLFHSNNTQDDELQRAADTNNEVHSSSKSDKSSSVDHDVERQRASHSDDMSSAADVVVAERGAAGVARAEAFTRMLRGSARGRTLLFALAVCLGLTMFAYALDQTLTFSVFAVIAASFFNRHSQLAAISTAQTIIVAVTKPFVGKLSDLTSRPTVYLIVLIVYCVGFAVAASAQTFAAYVVGICFTASSRSGIDLLADIIVSDLTPLQWRQFFTAMLSSPFFVTAYVGGFISEGLVDNHWRWGAGMFAIIMPVLLGPVIILLFYAQRQAHKQGMISFGDSGVVRKGTQEQFAGMTVFQTVKKAMIDIDAVGLLLLGFGVALILLPFSLAKSAKGGWGNPSMIAMLVVGFVFCILLAIWEQYFAPVPLAPRRVLRNRAFLLAVGIDITQQMAGQVEALYFSSYVYVVKDWTLYQWTAFVSTTTVGLTFWGITNGLLQRVTHRFKAQMVFGGVCKLVAYSMLLEPGLLGTTSTVRLSIVVILLGFGGMTVGGARIASQASVAHRDLATVIFTVSLYSSIGSAFGSAIAAQVWQQKMPDYLRQELPGVDAATIKKLFGNIKATRDNYAFDSPIRQGVIRAYQRVNGYLFLAAACLSIVPLVLSLCVPNYYLGSQHNLVQNVDLDGKPVRVIERRERYDYDPATATVWQKIRHTLIKIWDA